MKQLINGFSYDPASFIPADEKALLISRGKRVLASLTRPNNATPYVAGTACVVGTNPATYLTFETNAIEPGSAFLIAGYKFRIDRDTIPAGMGNFRIHIYNAPPTAIADGAAFNLPAADRDKYMGYITMGLPVDLGDTLWSQDDNVNFSCRLADGSTAFYGILETLGSYTPTALTVKTIRFLILGV